MVWQSIFQRKWTDSALVYKYFIATAVFNQENKETRTNVASQHDEAQLSNEKELQMVTLTNAYFETESQNWTHKNPRYEVETEHDGDTQDGGAPLNLNSSNDPEETARENASSLDMCPENSAHLGRCSVYTRLHVKGK